jgi:hypothetical protein
MPACGVTTTRGGVVEILLCPSRAAVLFGDRTG